MTSARAPGAGDTEAKWRGLLLGTDPRFARARAVFRHIPSEPRCKMCAAPFGGLGGPLMRVVGRAPWSKNPRYCGMCFDALLQGRGGAEIECSLLFADVRGSTTLAEGMRPAEFGALLERFYETSARILVAHDAIVDKFVGDEVFALFVPALTGNRHAARAIDAAKSLLAAFARDETLPIGAGVDTGTAFVGAIGDPPTDVTALGDVVNTAARMASAAGAGEVLISDAAMNAAGRSPEGLERRELTLRGKTSPTSVYVLRPALRLGPLDS